MTLRQIRLALWSTTAVAAVAWLVLIVVAVAWQPMPTTPDLAMTAQAKNTQEINLQNLPPIEAFERIWNLDLQQPLNDAPLEASQGAQVAASSAPLSCRLLGTVIEPGHTLALFVASNGQIEFKAVGEQIDNADIRQITAERVTLFRAGQTVQLTLPESVAQ